MQIRNNWLHVPGATLYYELRGTGPLLLLIHGSNGDAYSFPMADTLAAHFTVVTYDRRGHSRSTIIDPTEPYQIRTHATDAHHLLSHLTTESAYVFGISTGAIIALDLALQHPEQIHKLVAFEPPLPNLLTGAARDEAAQDLRDLATGFEQNPMAAFQTFASKMGITGQSKPTERPAEWSVANMTYYMEQEIPGILDTQLELAQLATDTRPPATWIIPAAGEQSRGYPPYQFAEAVANQLGTSLALFPGDHVGANQYPVEFAERLHEVLSAS